MAASLLRVALAALCAEHASAAVIGIDFGARFIKVGIIQPGKGIELVLNEASKRKSSAAAGFNTAGERVYADDSFNLLGKLPGQQFVYSKLLLGKNVSHPHVLSFGELGYPYQFSTGAATAQGAHTARAGGGQGGGSCLCASLDAGIGGAT
jgi:hypoxia up-regulated 1